MSLRLLELLSLPRKLARWAVDLLQEFARGSAGRALPTRKPFDRYLYTRHPESKPCTLSTPAGQYVYVQDAGGVVWVAPDGPHQHPRVLGNAFPAAAAGELTLGEESRVVEVNNLSGTFRLGPETLDPVVQALRDMGWDVPADAIRRYPEDVL